MIKQTVIVVFAVAAMAVRDAGCAGVEIVGYSLSKNLYMGATHRQGDRQNILLCQHAYGSQ